MAQPTPPNALDDLDLDRMKREAALTQAVILHGPGETAEDVLQTASEFYAWLEAPRAYVLKGTAAWTAYVRFAKRKAATRKPAADQTS